MHQAFQCINVCHPIWSLHNLCNLIKSHLEHRINAIRVSMLSHTVLNFEAFGVNGTHNGVPCHNFIPILFGSLHNRLFKGWNKDGLTRSGGRIVQTRAQLMSDSPRCRLKVLLICIFIQVERVWLLRCLLESLFEWCASLVALLDDRHRRFFTFKEAFETSSWVFSQIKQKACSLVFNTSRCILLRHVAACELWLTLVYHETVPTVLCQKFAIECIWSRWLIWSILGLLFFDISEWFGTDVSGPCQYLRCQHLVELLTVYKTI